MTDTTALSTLIAAVAADQAAILDFQNRMTALETGGPSGITLQQINDLIAAAVPTDAHISDVIGAATTDVNSPTYKACRALFVSAMNARLGYVMHNLKSQLDAAPASMTTDQLKAYIYAMIKALTL